MAEAAVVNELDRTPTQPVKEMIGRDGFYGGQVNLWRSRSRVQTIDETVSDYEFYDRLRRGKAAGYALGGLFCARIERIMASWVIGSGLEVELYESETAPIPEDRRDYTNGLLKEFVAGLLDAGQTDDETPTDTDDHQASQLQAIYRDALGLGDQYIIVNADGSLSVPSPDTVTVERDPLDYRRVLSVTVETKNRGYIITDQYRADGRTLTIKRGAELISTQQFQNLLGVIPVVHVAYGRSGNETNGHSIHEVLRPLYDQYDDLTYKQLDGAKLLGSPILTLAGMKDLNAVKNLNQASDQQTYIDREGNEVTRQQLNIDSNAVLLIGEGGSAGFTAPPTGFTEDTKTALKTLFLLLLDHTGIPESVWGGELGSARASADTQLGQFVKEIVGWQRDAGGWIVRLCRLWLMTKALIDPQVWVGRLAIEWAPVVDEDKELRLKYVELGRKESLLSDETALTLLHLVDDPAAEVEAARTEADERRDREFPDGAYQFGAALNGAQRNEEIALMGEEEN